MNLPTRIFGGSAVSIAADSAHAIASMYTSAIRRLISADKCAVDGDLQPLSVQASCQWRGYYDIFIQQLENIDVFLQIKQVHIIL